MSLTNVKTKSATSSPATNKGLSGSSRIRGVFSLLFLPLVFAYLEIILRVTAGDGFSLLPTVGMIVLSFGAGFLCDLICTAFPEKAARWIAFAFAVLASVFFLLMYFVNNSYRAYMDIRSILAGTGYVLEGFGETVAGTITRGALYILLYLAPTLLILYPMIRGYFTVSHAGKWQPISCAVLAVVLLASAPFIMTARMSDREKYTSEFRFDSSVRHFGLTTAVKLDAVYSIFGNPFETLGFDFSIDKPEPIKVYELPDVFPEPVAKPVEPDVPDTPAEPDLPDEEITPAEEIVPPEPVEYGYNEYPIDYTVLAGGAKDRTLADMYTLVASQTPSKQNEYTGLFEGKNLILITAEAFSAEIIDEEKTPTLWRLANKGIKFDDYYQPAWGGSTSTGEFSVITGIMPADGIASVKETIGHKMYMTIGSQLMRLGYASGAYHNGSYTYYGRNLTHENFGYAKFIAMGNGMEKGVSAGWPESDLEMFSYIMPEFIEGGEPFSLYFMTVSGHCGYARTNNSMSLKNYSVYENEDMSEVMKCYYAANYELERAMTYLVGALEDAGIADDTVIVISTDHYPYGLEDSAAWGTDRDYLEELFGYRADSNVHRDHSALIMWCGCLEDRDEPIEITAPVYSLDIVPTLSNLFGVEFDSRLLTGRDIFSDAEPLVIWQDYSWKTDKGYYNSPTGVFTPVDGTTVDGGYIDRIKATVRNKITFARGLLTRDFCAPIPDAIEAAKAAMADE